MEIYQVGAGAAINETTRFANITLAESDNPRGVVYFTVGHRLPIATLMTTRLSLQVYRQASTASPMALQYRTVVRENNSAIKDNIFRDNNFGQYCTWPEMIIFN